ncbi:HAD family hydrolase [Cohnella panacarvi]|uniref:HAD family hydrolase n=1 Tax=Cohnella panacarvi TaxID=400776 RepID=UPI00047D815F|nr:HAD family hydrolase [Cohnella panacarvi]
MRTLYVSDMDGTLLNDEQRVNPESVRILNGLIDKGLQFTVATARSYESATRLLAGLNLHLPGIFINGVFIADPHSGRIIESHYLSNELGQEIVGLYLQAGLNPVVYTINDEGQSRVYYRGVHNPSEDYYFGDRLQTESERFRLVDDYTECLKEKLIAVNAIETPDRLQAVYEVLDKREGCICHFGPDIYAPGYHWLEVSSDQATKRKGTQRLKELLSFDKLVCFGDNLNDLSMFEGADECYAVSNAHESVKQIATGIIDSNNNDGVARFLAEHGQKSAGGVAIWVPEKK